MTIEQKKREIRNAQSSVESAKMKLINIAYHLEEVGCIRQAKSLQTIIGQLEDWQNK